MGAIGRLNESLKTHVPNLWRWTKALVLLCVFLAVLVIIARIVVDIYGSHKLSEAREAAAAAGVHLSMDALLATLPELSDTENAANYYEAACALMRAKGFEPDRPTVPVVSRSPASPHRPPRTDDERIAVDLEKVTEDPRLPMPKYMLADTISYVAQRQVVLDVIREGAALPDARYRVEWQGYRTDLRHLSDIRGAARVLYVAAWADAEEKKPHEAVANVRDIFALARSLRNEPNLISSLVEIALGSIGTSCLQHVVARSDVDSADLETLQKDLEDLANTFSIRLAMEGELAQYCDFENSMIDGGLSPEEALGQIRYSGSDEKTPPAKHSEFGQLAVSLLKGYLEADEAFAIGCYLNIIKELENPSPASLLHSKGGPTFDTLQKSPFILARMMIPALTHANPQAATMRARLRATAAALAALRFKNDTGAWPETLDALVPQYLSAVPVDPFSGKPLIYTTLEGGIVVYSVGLNGIDDGGRGSGLSIEKDRDAPYYDTGFRVWR